MAHRKREPTGEPTEKTPKGFEVPVPKRRDVLANLKKVARVGKDSAPRSAKK